VLARSATTLALISGLVLRTSRSTCMP